MNTHNPRSMFISVTLAVAIAASVTLMGLNLGLLRQKITNLQARLMSETVARQGAEKNLADTQTNLAATTASLKATRTALDTALAEKQEALATAAAQAARAEKLSADLARVSQEREKAQAELARYRAAGLEPDQIVAAAQRIKQLAADLAAAQQTNITLIAQIKQQEVAQEGPILLPSGLRARVIAFDPKWHFIVLDAGEKQGMLKNAEVLVSRQGKLIARARVSRVHSDRCIADLLPGWELADVLETDLAMPAFPHS